MTEVIGGNLFNKYIDSGCTLKPEFKYFSKSFDVFPFAFTAKGSYYSKNGNEINYSSLTQLFHYFSGLDNIKP